MDPTTLVKEQIDYGAQFVERLPKEGIEVLAAFWVKLAENGRWYFYVVSPVEEEDPRHAGGRLVRLARQMPRPYWIDPFDVNLLGPSDPLARGALELYKRGPQEFPMIYREGWMGNKSIEGGYFYPAPAAPERLPAVASGQ
jgi:hypothetical protein